MSNAPTTVTIRGVVCLYFNRPKDAPRVWCISDEARSWEIQVAEVHVTAAMHTVYDPEVKAQPGHEGPPAAYLKSSRPVEVTVVGPEAFINRDKTT